MLQPRLRFLLLGMVQSRVKVGVWHRYGVWFHCQNQSPFNGEDTECCSVLQPSRGDPRYPSEKEQRRVRSPPALSRPLTEKPAVYLEVMLSR